MKHAGMGGWHIQPNYMKEVSVLLISEIYSDKKLFLLSVNNCTLMEKKNKIFI